METIGTAIDGRYRLDRLAGRGGFARVYLATDLRLRRQIAVKILDANLEANHEGQDFVARFEREAQAVAALDHPNILGVYDSGESNGLIYLVMPFVEGGNLADRLRGGGRLTPAQTITYLRQAAHALDYAHRRGIVHRDVKPQNMLLRAEDDRLLLADFGIAKVLSSTNTESRTAIMGTLTYMAPEQFQGHVTPAVDRYALGVVLFQLLTGQVPYSGGTEQVMYGHLMAPVPNVVERGGGGLPAAVQAVLDRALAKQPSERFPSGEALMQAVEAAFAASPDPVGTTSRPTRLVEANPAHDGATLVATPQQLHDGATQYATGPVGASPSGQGQATQYAPPAAYGGIPPRAPAPAPGAATPAPRRRRGLLAGAGALVVVLLLLALGGAAVGASRLMGRASATATPGPSAANVSTLAGTATVAPTPMQEATATPVPAPIAAPAPTATGVPPTPRPTMPPPTTVPAAAPTATKLVAAVPPTATAAAAQARQLAGFTQGHFYIDTNGRFNLYFPTDWYQVQAQDVDVSFRSPSTLGGYSPTTWVTAEGLSLPTTLDEYAASMDTKLRALYPDYRRLTSEKVLVGTHIAYESRFTATIDGVPLEVQYVALIESGGIYKITSAAVQAKFDQFGSILEQIAGSFRLGARR